MFWGGCSARNPLHFGPCQIIDKVRGYVGGRLSGYKRYDFRAECVYNGGKNSDMVKGKFDALFDYSSFV